MSARFAALESRVNSAVFSHLSNADGVLDGVAVLGIFDNAYAQESVGGAGMASTAPIFTLATSAVPALVVGKALVLGAITYTVVEHQPDGTGVSLLLLERSA